MVFVFGTTSFTDLYEKANTYAEAFQYAETDAEGEDIICVMCPEKGTDYNLCGSREEKLLFLEKLD